MGRSGSPGPLVVLLVASAYSLPAEISIEAAIRGRVFAPREAAVLDLTLENRDSSTIVVPDPARGDALRITLRRADQSSIVLVPGQSPPGVPPQGAQVSVPPGVRRSFEFDLARLGHVSTPGEYTAVVEYVSTTGQPWKSGELRFSITKPAGRFFANVPSEASRTAQFSLLWTEPTENQARTLLLDYRSVGPGQTDDELEVWGAQEVASHSPHASPALSMGPPGHPFPDRWLAWIDGRQMYARYHARDRKNRLTARSVQVPANGFLVTPLVAERPPDNGRPGCDAALIVPSASGSSLQPLRISRTGQIALGQAIALPGEVVEARATPGADGRPIFVVVVNVKSELVVEAFTCSQRTCLPGNIWLRTPSQFGALDVRFNRNSGVTAGLVLRTARGWERVVVREPGGRDKSAPIWAPVRIDSSAQPAAARLDERSQLHSLFVEGSRLYYSAPAGAEAKPISSPSASSGKFWDLFISPNRPAKVVYYDAVQGPRLETLR